MDSIEAIFDEHRASGQIHHAYVILADQATAPAMIAYLKEMLEKHFAFSARGNPDLWEGIYDSFGIEEGRLLKELQLNRPAMGERKVFIVQTNFFTLEAQNSLLKVLEEPAEGSLFFLFLPSAEMLLPTLRSRVQVVRSIPPAPKSEDSSSTATASFTIARKFAHAAKPERLEIVKSMVEKKDKMTAIEFLERVENIFHEKLLSSPKTHSIEIANGLEQLMAMKGYASDRSASLKLILEHIALVLPVLS